MRKAAELQGCPITGLWSSDFSASESEHRLIDI